MQKQTFKGVIVISKEDYTSLQSQNKVKEGYLYVTNTFIEAIDVSTLNTFEKVIVDTLPSESNASSKNLYLVNKSTQENQDYYDEYLLIGGRWEKVGNTKISLENYYTKSEIDTKIQNINKSINDTIEGEY